LVVDTYGVPNYKEANPAIFAAVSFPFLFGVMFGDIMHGTLLLIFSIWLCNADEKTLNYTKALYPGRYFFLLMGIFSTYMGIIYNDLTSMTVQWFG